MIIIIYGKWAWVPLCQKTLGGFSRGVDYLYEGRWISRAFWLGIRLVIVGL